MPSALSLSKYSFTSIIEKPFAVAAEVKDEMWWV
jgi:hypothetical protein